MKGKEIIGHNIKAFRKRERMTLQELADRIGTSKSTLSRYENGLLEASFDTVVDIASVLKTNPGYIYGFGPFAEDRK